MTGTALHRRTGADRLTASSARFVTVVLFTLLLPLATFAKLGVEFQMLLGNPSGATTDGSNHVHYLHQRSQYVMDYNDTHRQANWVSWNFTTSDRGGFPRLDNFAPDTSLPAGFFIVQANGYSGSGYDRGHMCPSADRTASRADNDATFFMSNMVPQHPDNNQGVWANFENYTRTLGDDGSEVLITCGPGGFTGATISTGIPLATYVWKVVVVVPPGAGNTIDRITASTRVIAIEIPNVAMNRSTPWQDFLTSPAVIEGDTGLTFFTALSPAVRSALRLKIDGQVSGGPVITGQPGNQTVNVGDTATFTVTATGNPVLTYQWFKGEDLLAGATAATLEVVNVQPADVGAYSVVVSNSVGSAVSNNATLALVGAPAITTHPQPQTVLPGTPATFSVVATGNATLGYQWFKNDVLLPGETGDTLSIGSVLAADLGSYNVVVTNSIGSAASNYALLAFAVAPSITTQPVPQSVFTGATATFTVGVSGTGPLSYQWYRNAAPIGGATSATYNLANVQLTDAGNFHVVVTNLAGFATSNTVALTVTEAPPTSDIYWNFATATPTSGLPATLTGGTVSQGNNNGSAGSPPLIQTNSVSSGYPGASGTNNATIAARIGGLDKNANGSAYFEFTFTPVAGKQFVANGLKFGARSTGTGPKAYSVFTSLDGYTTAIASDTTVLSDSNWKLYTPSIGTISGPLNTAVTFRIYGHNGTGSPAVGTANWRIDDLTVTAGAVTPAVAPTITTHPLSQNGFVAGEVTFTVAADGTAPFTYQWRKGGADIAGATGASLTLTSLEFDDAGSYDVVVTNSVSSATSNAAMLTLFETFETWASLAGLTAPNDAALADPDFDGVVNFLEYALNRSATTAETAPATTLTIEGGQLVYRFTRPKWVSGLTYTVEASTDLAGWSPVSTSVESSTATTETLVATLPLDQPKRFFHLLVTR